MLLASQLVLGANVLLRSGVDPVFAQVLVTNKWYQSRWVTLMTQIHSKYDCY